MSNGAETERANGATALAPPPPAPLAMPAQFAYEHNVLGYVASRAAGLGEPDGPVAALYEEHVVHVRRHAYDDYHTLTFQLGGAPLGRLGRDGSIVEAMCPGTLAIQPAPIESLWQSTGRTRWMQFYLPIDAVHDALAHERPHARRAATLDRRVGTGDPGLVYTLYRCAVDVARDSSVDSECLQAYALTLAGVLARRLAGLGCGEENVFDRERLSPRQLARALEFIESCLEARPTAAAVAAELGLSRYHFSRAFTGATGESPYRYIQRARLASALRLVSGSECPLLEIATDVGYATQAHMTSAFTRFLGASPGEIRALAFGRRPGIARRAH